MCGICGMTGGADVALLQRMVKSIHHRGPDDSGVWVSPDRSLGLGNTRLAIQDLSAAGHMPMPNEDESIWLTYNGEIYNFPQLRAELTALGHRFRSRTDSEVLVHGWESWGTDLFRRLNGMFALAIVDTRQGPPTLILARDRFGIKPLYYWSDEKSLVFGSEIKTMLLDGRVPRAVNPTTVHRFLAFGWVTGPETMFAGIQKLAPGHYLTWREGQSCVRSYWDLRFHAGPQQSVEEWRHDLAAALSRAVERHLISDVPVGVFLSGGVDSSAILALASRATRAPVKAYTIVYRPQDSRLEQSGDDAKYARLMAKACGADFHEILVEPDIVQLLPKAVLHLDEPVADPAAISTYLISCAARPDLKVLLSGQGADEVFAGYRIHRNHHLAELIRQLPAWLRNGPSSAALRMLPAVAGHVPGLSPGLVMAAHRYLRQLLAGAALSPEERYVFYRSYYADRDQRVLYTPSFGQQVQNEVAGIRHLEYFAAVPNEDFLNRVLYVDAKTFLPELNLTYSDKMSAAASIEVRVPFLDAELVELAARTPPALKLRGVRGKYILKEALKDLVPSKILHRRKAGFGAPIRNWLRNDLREMVDDVLDERSLQARGYFEAAAVRRMILDDRAGRADHAYRIWSLLTLELWHRTFIDAPVVPR